LLIFAIIAIISFEMPGLFDIKKDVARLLMRAPDAKKPRSAPRA